MTIKSDKWIRTQAEQGMITPFESGQITANASGERTISFGVSSYGYDARCGNEFKLFVPNGSNGIIDPKNFDESICLNHYGDHIIVPPHGFVLAHTVEYFKIPNDVLVVCLGKSTYARCGIVANVTPLEPGWEGQVTLEFSNTTHLPAKIYANEGCVQMLFFQSDERCEVSYADRKGKYQQQTHVTTPKMK